jgi:hypothetical protein
MFRWWCFQKGEFAMAMFHSIIIGSGQAGNLLPFDPGFDTVGWEGGGPNNQYANEQHVAD